MSKRFAALCFVAALLAACTAYADGIIVPVPPPGRAMPPPLSIKYHHVQVAINNQVARTEVDQVFKNNFGAEIEGTYIFPIPEEALINDFSIYVGGEKIAAKLLDRDSALKTYEEIVRRNRDPALLEYAGRAMFKARVYPIPSYGDKRVGLVYDELLRNDGGLCSYRYTLNTEKFSAEPLEDVRVKVVVTARSPILSVYSPTHEIQVERTSPTKVEVSYEEKNVKPDKDFILYYKLSKEQVDASLLTYKEKGEDGYFLLLVSPNSWAVDEKVLPKDIIFVFDRSGSMSGGKIDQAVSSLLFCLNSLNPEDRFGLVTFNDVVEPFSTKLLPASKENVGRAREFVRKLSANGGTDIHDALTSALEMAEADSRPTMLLFLTDGLPTVGITDVEEIVKRAKQRVKAGTRVFTFGVGYDVNTSLLDRLSSENKGASEYVRPNEDIEVKVSSLYSKIMNPVFTDVKIDFGRAEARFVYPAGVPDIFKGSQLVIAGRYRNPGSAVLTLTGNMGDRRRTFEYKLLFDGESRLNSFVPLLWASRRIGYLVEEIRLHGRNEELVQEIVKLSKRFGIMTEYTSFLVDTDLSVALPEAAPLVARRMDKASESAVGGWAVNQSVNAKKMKESSQVSFNTYYDAEGREQKVANVAQVAGHAFFNQKGNWIETSVATDEPKIKVERFSKAYFQMLEMDASIGSYLALGENITFRIGTNQIEIADTGKQVFTSSELRELFR
jgi:Ca-activated chloride channel family protein